MIVKRTITKDDISEMPKVNFEGKIIMICTEKDAERAVDFLNKFPVLGIDSETKPSFVKGKSHKVSLLQIATNEHCFLFRLNLIGFPQVLIGLLENPLIVKVGLSLKDDFLAMHKRVTFKQQNCIELQEFVKPFGIQDKSLQKIYAILFGHKISKSQRLSNWEAESLSSSQAVICSY
jgi:Ribonuclease D